ncbi:MAG: ATP-dependent DNA helicase RecG [Cyanobacteriota/Melainabacteria group bacterium]
MVKPVSSVTRDGNSQKTKEDAVKAMVKALDIERRSRYSDFHGKRSTFSQFMRQSSARLCRKYPLESIWMTLRGLFRQYPNTDVATRISIVRRADELLAAYNRGMGWTLGRLEEDVTSPAVAASSVEQDSIQYANGVMEGGSEEYFAAAKSSSSTASGSAPATSDVSIASAGSAAPAATSTSTAVSTASTAASAASAVASTTTSSSSSSSSSSRSSSSSSTRPAVQGPSTASAAPGGGRDSIDDPAAVDVQYVKGVGPKMSGTLAKVGIHTVMDLLKHYPRRHLDFQNRLKICDLEEDQEVSIFGTIQSVSAFQSKKRSVSVMTVLIADGTGSVGITRFVGGKSNKYLLERYKQQFPKGAQVMASGVVERDRFSKRFQLKNAEVEVLGLLSDQAEDSRTSLHAGRLVPVYPLTEGLSLRHLRTVIHNALEKYDRGLKDPLPDFVLSQLNLMRFKDALRTIHFPDDIETKDEARRRLVFDELFGIQLQLAHRRYKFDQTETALEMECKSDGLVAKLKESLPFTLTGAQERVFREISRDLSSAKPMHRLVQGDVGSGKTVVALMAFLVAIENGFQGAMMAPTEILAEQHYRQFQRLLTPLGLRCALVLGKQGVKQRREIHQEILSGPVHIAVGTHALIEDKVEFNNLGLIIIDEQHRFGVKQRARLKAKSQSPELLTMTATPIPRTLAMTMHGDLDVSEIDELPPGRKPIKTSLLRPSQKREMWDFVLKEVETGRQVYIVFPLIDESESLSAKAATAEFEKLVKKFPKLKFGLMHGKLKPKEKDEVMEQFRDGEYHVLVSTTVIEVGVDVPNSTIMIIENADRFGLAQLHQLRGRVGRGGDQSYCFLVSDSKSQSTRERLEILTLTTDGFVVAEKDLEIRGPGEFMGFKQSGLPDLVLADLVQDAKILEDARNTAIAIVKEDPELENYPGLKKLIAQKVSTTEAEVMRSG